MLEQYYCQYDLNGCCLRAPWIMEKDDFKCHLSFAEDQFGAPRCRELATRVVWIDTTLGVTWSAIASKALPVSASDCTCDVDGFAPFEPSCAKPKRVRSNPDANSRPQTNAVTTATPRRAREKLVGILGYPLLKRCCDPLSVLYKTGAPCSRF